MRVEIRHRDYGEWIRRHVVDVAVQLTQDDRRIIDERGLITSLLDVSPGVINYFPIPRWVSTVCMIVSPCFFLGGCVTSCVASIAGASSPGGFMVFLAFALFGFAIFIRLQRGRMRNFITIRELYETPHATVTVVNPIEALAVNRSIKRTLADMQLVITEIDKLSVEIIEL